MSVRPRRMLSARPIIRFAPMQADGYIDGCPPSSLIVLSILSTPAVRSGASPSSLRK